MVGWAGNQFGAAWQGTKREGEGGSGEWSRRMGGEKIDVGDRQRRKAAQFMQCAVVSSFFPKKKDEKERASSGN